MGDHSSIWCSPVPPCRGLGRTWMAAFLAILASMGSSALCAETATSLRRSVVSDGVLAADFSVPPVLGRDVVLQNGTLRGVILRILPGPAREVPVPGVRVSILAEGTIVAETVSDQAGRFTVSYLRGGSYLIAATGKEGTSRSLHRVWTPSGAPPRASSLARVFLEPAIVRGQGTFPAISSSEAALMGGVAVGAVAAPVIYHNAQTSNRIPASP